MIADDKGNIFEDRRKADRRAENRRKLNIKVEVERRSGQDRRQNSDKRKK